MNELMDLHPHEWPLLILARQNHHHVLAAAAQLAERGPLIVLDCGRQFDSSAVARAARGQREVVDRIRVQRAFICSEVVKLLEQTPAGKTPILILDLLSTFYDENVRIDTRRYLLETALRHFRRLSRGAGLAVTVQPPPAPEDHDSFHLFKRLWSSTPRVLFYEQPANHPPQLRLFPWET